MRRMLIVALKALAMASTRNSSRGIWAGLIIVREVLSMLNPLVIGSSNWYRASSCVTTEHGYSIAFQNAVLVILPSEK